MSYNDQHQQAHEPADRQNPLPGTTAAPVQHPLANYQFSSEELRVLKECERESFFQRSMPLGTGLGVATYMAVQNGMLSASARFGAAPKCAIAVIVGYFIGKFSYQAECAEKIMQLPDSKLAEMLRMRKKGGLAETFSVDQGYGSALSMAPFSSATDQYSDVSRAGKSTSLNMDTERPSNHGLDDSFRPKLDGNETKFEDNLPLEPPKSQTTYDELRKRNRDEFQQKKSSPYYRPMEVGPDQPPVIRAPISPPPSSSDDGPIGGNQKKNKYGDEWSR